MKKILSGLFALAVSATAALAQSNPGLVFGQVPTAGQWNSYFAGKTDFPPQAAALSGIVPLANGGAGAALTASNGGIVYSTATALAVLPGTGTANQCLLSGSNAAPSWGSCSGAAAVSSVTNSDSTLTISPTTGAVVASLNLAHANTWTATQTLSGLTLSGITGSTQCLQVNSSGVVSGSSAACSTVTSVSNSDSSLTIAPTTGAVVAAINAAHANTWSAMQTFTGATPSVQITPPASTIDQGIILTQNGLASSATAGNCTGCLGNGFAYNFFNIASDNVNAVTGPTQGAVGFAFQMNSGGSNTAGERSVIYISQQLTAADNPNNTSNPFPFYIGWVSQTASAVNDGGTVGTPRGQLFGFNPQVILKSGATFYDTIAGAEIDVSALTGSSVNFKYGFNVVDEGQVHATSHEWAYGVSSSIGWKIGFAGDDFNFGTSPIASNGTFIGTDFSGGPYTIATGIDLTGFTGASNALAIKSHSFGVGWVGDVQLRHVEGLTIPTASSCPGFSLSSQSSDLGGSVTMNSATTCTIQFGQTYLFAPFCTVTPVTTTAAVGVSTTTSTMAAFFGASQTQFNYVCIGV